MAYHLEFTDRVSDDIIDHKKAGNKAVLNKLLLFLEELEDTPIQEPANPNNLNTAFPVAGLAR